MPGGSKLPRRRICLPEFPADYTSIVSLRPENALLLHPAGGRLSYALTGWIEHSLERPAKGDPSRSVGFALRNLNISGELEGCDADDAPRRIQAALARTDSPPRTTIDLATGKACLTIPIEISYDELARDRRYLRKPRAKHFESIIPLATTLSVAFDYDLEKGGFVASGAGSLPRLPPLSNVSTPIFFLLLCPCIAKSFCLEVCLSVKVATAADGTPIMTPAEVRELVRRVNDIWDCVPPAQCCIRFRAREILAPLAPRVPLTVTEDDDGQPSVDFNNTLMIARSDVCYNVCLVNDFVGTTDTGKTNSIAPTGTIVRVKGRPTADVAQTLAHELGHALGLARGAGTEADGVDAHSDKDGNVMNPAARATRTDLNLSQCTRARASALAKLTIRECKPAPNE